MKKLLALLLSTALLLPLYGCAKTPASAPSAAEASPTAAPQSTKASTEGTTLSFWYCYTDKVQENNVNLAKAFNESVGKDMGITVNAEYQGDYATLSQKLKAAYVSGTAPAVTVMEIGMLEPFTTSKVLQSLDAYIKRDNLDIKDFQPAFMTDSYFNNQCYSLPYLRSTPILYLNTTLLKQAGLDPKGPATWEELETYAKTVKEKTGKYGVSSYTDSWLFQAFMMEQGSSLFNNDATTTAINSPAAKKVISFFSNLRDNGSAHLLAGSATNNFLADISSQNCAMWFSSTGALTTFIGLGQKNQFEIATTFLPKGIQHGCPTGGANLVMTSKLSESEKESAWQFIRWMTTKEQTIKASTTTGYLPSRISAVNDPSMQALYQKMPQFKVALDQLEYAGGRTVSATEAYAEMVKSLDSIWINNQDVNTTLAALETKVNGLLKK